MTQNIVFLYGCVCLGFFLLVNSLQAEQLDRGLVAIEMKDGSVFLSWRLLDSDPEDIRFSIVRLKEPGHIYSLEDFITRNLKQTCYIDESAIQLDRPQNALYEIHCHSKIKKVDSTSTSFYKIKLTGNAKPYISIPLKGDYDFQKVGVGDLDGDGEYEYVIKQPNFNTDPYQKPGYWKRSTTTYKIEAYQPDGTFMWRHDMGWSIEAGIWYAPWVVYDVDGDGKAEVYCKGGEGDPRDEKGLVTSGPEYLFKLGGETGKIVAQKPWLSRDGFSQYNYYQRNFLAIAYLDGKSPSLIMQRGTYRLIKMQALDKNLDRIWYWHADQEKQKYRGQSSHGLYPADVDQDGRDEMIMGAAVIDDNGKGLWSLEMGHPDVCYCGDIDRDNPGLEIYYGFETRQQIDGLCVVDARTGEKLWAHKKPTRPIHGQGMAGDILAEYPGQEVFGGERDYNERFLYSAQGKLIEFLGSGTLTPRPIWWDTDPQKEVIISNKIRDWKGKTYQSLSGQVIAVMDCIGDHREEVVTALEGELRIYTTTIPSPSRRTCLMQDHQYRLGVTAQTSGYYYPAQLGL